VAHQQAENHQQCRYSPCWQRPAPVGEKPGAEKPPVEVRAVSTIGPQAADGGPLPIASRQGHRFLQDVMAKFNDQDSILCRQTHQDQPFRPGRRCPGKESRPARPRQTLPARPANGWIKMMIGSRKLLARRAASTGNVVTRPSTKSCWVLPPAWDALSGQSHHSSDR